MVYIFLYTQANYFQPDLAGSVNRMHELKTIPKPATSVPSDLQAPLAGEVALTHEDIDRAHDREVVWQTRARRGFGSRARLLWLLIGPGILVMLGENDGPSMLSYAATGAHYGIGFFLPFVVLTFVMACVVQEMTVRLGSATHRGHAELIFDRFGPFWGWFSMIDLMVGNFLTLVTEFIAIRAGLGFFGVPPAVSVLGAWLVLFVALMAHRYWTWERIILVAAMFNLVFIPVALLTHPHWRALGSALITWGPRPGLTQETVLILLSNIGATVTPWMLFFQQSAIADKGLTTHDIRFGRIDTVLGATLAAIAALATIVCTAPLFAHGMFEAGMVAAITISTSSAYAFGEVAHRPHSLNLPFQQGKSFYLVLILEAAAAAALVLIPGIPLVYIVLVVNVIAVLAMPPALLFLYMLVNDREIMGDLVSPLWANIMALAVVIILVAAGILFGISVVAPRALALLGGN